MASSFAPPFQSMFASNSGGNTQTGTPAAQASANGAQGGTQASSPNQPVSPQGVIGGQSNGYPSNPTTPQASNGSIGIGQQLPWAGNQYAVQQPTPTPNSQLQSSFLGSNQTAPYYNQAATAGNLGTGTATNTGAANSFMAGLFGPGLSQANQATLQSGTNAAQIALEQAQNKQSAQWENTPFSGGALAANADTALQFSNQLLGEAGSLGQAQQAQATQVSNVPFQDTMQAAAVPVQDAQGLFNTAQTAYSSYTQQPDSVYAQLPLFSPTLLSQAQSPQKAV